MTDWRVLRGRVERWAVHYHGEPFHALLCDPPYHLTEIKGGIGQTIKVGQSRGTQARTDSDKAARRGFMGKTWDGGDVAFDPATWAALAEHLLPGAFGMAFASSRGWHRLAVAIEDAGLIIHPSIFGWLQGQGFPKATRVNHGAAGFAGHRYGLQALKPALEPIIVWQKPYAGRPAACIAATGAGALNIDAARIGTTKDVPASRSHKERGACYGQYQPDPEGAGGFDPALGRWPANFALCHLPGCSGACAPGCPVQALGEQSGERAAGAHPAHRGAGTAGYHGWPTGTEGERIETDTGTAARFFFCADWALDVAERLAAAEPVRYVAKAGRRERDAGLEAWEPRMYDTAVSRASQVAGLENTNGRGSHSGPKRNPHPTVKPLALARWLATLLLPPPEYAPRRILVPFAGSGSEMIGAALAGWEYVLGIEGEREYADIARARLAHWCAAARQPALLEVEP